MCCSFLSFHLLSSSAFLLWIRIMACQKEQPRLISAYAVIFITAGWKGVKKLLPFFFSCYGLTDSQLGELGKLFLPVYQLVGEWVRACGRWCWKQQSSSQGWPRAILLGYSRLLYPFVGSPPPARFPCRISPPLSVCHIFLHGSRRVWELWAGLLLS